MVGGEIRLSPAHASQALGSRSSSASCLAANCRRNAKVPMASSSALSNISSSALKLSSRLSENLQEGVRDLGIQSLDSLTGATGARLLDTPLSDDDAIRETKRLLASPKDREREEGLKRVLAVRFVGQCCVL